MVNYVLFETASGYSLFEVLQVEEIGAKLETVQQAVEDLAKFGKMVKLKAFVPFKNSVDALENANDISEGVVNAHLQAFLEMNMPKSKSKKKKANKVVLGVVDKNLASSIVAQFGYECDTSELVLELVRGIRLHSDKLLKDMKEGDLEKAQLGLGHSYSRAKVKFNVNRIDNMIIQAIALLDQIDKDINTFSMRIREWYSWHFPELIKIVNDNHQYAKLAKLIKNKGELTEEDLESIEEITGDESKAQQILDAARSSMGTDISIIDMINIGSFADRVIGLSDYRKGLHEYVQTKMNNVAPNLSALIGEIVGARLISHAGSLTNLSKYPASTVQILGAEKALFRALKTKGNTPKYGLLYHSTFIGRAGTKYKGKISRFLANKCTIASRIDCFSDKPTSKYGEALKEQVERRLDFYEKGSPCTKNEETMRKVLESLSEKVGMDLDEDEVISDEESSDEEMDIEEKPTNHFANNNNKASVSNKNIKAKDSKSSDESESEESDESATEEEVSSKEKKGQKKKAETKASEAKSSKLTTKSSKSKSSDESESEESDESETEEEVSSKEKKGQKKKAETKASEVKSSKITTKPSKETRPSTPKNAKPSTSNDAKASTPKDAKPSASKKAESKKSKKSTKSSLTEEFDKISKQVTEKLHGEEDEDKVEQPTPSSKVKETKKKAVPTPSSPKVKETKKETAAAESKVVEQSESKKRKAATSKSDDKPKKSAKVSFADDIGSAFHKTQDDTTSSDESEVEQPTPPSKVKGTKKKAVPTPSPPKVKETKKKTAEAEPKVAEKSESKKRKAATSKSDDRPKKSAKVFFADDIGFALNKIQEIPGTSSDESEAEQPIPSSPKVKETKKKAAATPSSPKVKETKKKAAATPSSPKVKETKKKAAATPSSPKVKETKKKAAAVDAKEKVAQSESKKPKAKTSKSDDIKPKKITRSTRSTTSKN
ncbi:9588_t:CDS:2 [Ambispora gerdemannii]|uniref:Nucleolar protein 56 n=1 Tax=Ambispora gerdemannii TaxID=144530 RepID=A0A9N9F1W1_9GLOM|nr:9588_t:CDS:2 [Ambispora gerdemannii]